jgi:prepilin-type N-terminal cleavage/methylation domain-containing protein
MQICLKRTSERAAFTLVEVLIAIAVAALFGIASFATNERLLMSLRSQRETTAATLMLQERMEALRSLVYSGIASNTTSATTSPPATSADVVANATNSEGPLSTMTETITVSGYQLAPSGTATTHSNVWQRNSTYPTGSMTDTVGSFDFVGNYDLIKVDIQVSWTSAGGRVRNRELSAIFGKGNRGS